MDALVWLRLIHAAVTWTLVGLIWTIQVVHYPLFDFVDPSRFATFHAAHSRRVTWLVSMLMPIEALCALLLLVVTPSPWTAAGMVLVVAIWMATAFLAVPRHSELSSGYSQTSHRALVATNWIRTIAWTVRGVVALRLLI